MFTLPTSGTLIINKEKSLWLGIEQAYLAFAQASKPFFLSDLDNLHQLAVSRTMEAAIAALYSVKGLPSTTGTDQTITQQLCEYFAQISLGVGGEIISAEIGTALERLRGRSLSVDSQGDLNVKTSPDQRSRGVYFTPRSLSDTMVRSALSEIMGQLKSLDDLRRLAILDPAAGGGAFLLSALRISVELLQKNLAFVGVDAAKLRQEVASHCLYGVDIDPVAIATVRALLVAEVGVANWSDVTLNTHLHVGDSVSVCLIDWEKWFPDRALKGFNVIVTNPPWSKLRPLRHEFFEHIDSSVRLLQGKALGSYLQEHMSDLIQGSWEQYVQRTIELSNRLRSCDEYVVNNAAYGDPDLYKFFLERSIALLAPEGIAALLLPSGVLRAQGSAPLRRLMRKEGELTEIVEYINRKKMFDIHSMYRFATIVFKKGSGGCKTFARFGETEPASSNLEKGIYLDHDFLDLVGGVDSLIPEVRSDAEQNLLARLYRENAVTGGGPRLSFRRELDMTNDSAHFIPAKDACLDGFRPDADGRWLSRYSRDVLIPVYEGRMVHQYDNSAKEYRSGDGRSANWETPEPGLGCISPHFFVTEKFAISRNWTPVERVGYCEISGHANERTLLAALIPPYAICGNKVPVLRAESNKESKLWLALANSLVVDWMMRRWVSTTINQFYWRNIPFPQNLSAIDRGFIISAAEALSAPNTGRATPEVWLGRRAQLRAAIDVVIINAYKVTQAECKTILDDFLIFNKAASRGKNPAMTLEELLALYSNAYSDKSLTLDTVYDLCAPQSCAATYATKAQAKWL